MRINVRITQHGTETYLAEAIGLMARGSSPRNAFNNLVNEIRGVYVGMTATVHPSGYIILR